MVNPSDFPSGSTPYIDWSDFSHLSNSQVSDPTVDQDLLALSTEPYSSVSNSSLPGAFRPEQSIAQHHVTYDPSVNNFAFRVDTTSQSADNFLLDYGSLSVGVQAAQNNGYDSLQPSFNFLNSFDMSDPTLDSSTGISELGGETKELRCTFPNCSEATFSTYPAFQKHLNKHYKPFRCSIPDCKTPNFGDKGSLDRHTREVHGSKRHYCLIASCKRHRTGFPRKYNLFEHQKRCHPSQSPNPAVSVLRTSGDQTLCRSESMEDVRISDKEGASPEVSVTGELSMGGSGKAQEKLKALFALRAEIDRDIETLKRTVDILDES